MMKSVHTGQTNMCSVLRKLAGVNVRFEKNETPALRVLQLWKIKPILEMDTKNRITVQNCMKQQQTRVDGRRKRRNLVLKKCQLTRILRED